jgi:small-conductance mechanosensitive channel
MSNRLTPKSDGPRRLCVFGAFILFVAATLAAPAPPVLYRKDAILGHLNQGITWYREVGGATQWIIQPSDEFFLQTQLGLAQQALKLAFEAATAQEPFTDHPVSADPSAAPDSDRRKMSDFKVTLGERVRALDSKIKDLGARIQSAKSDGERTELQDQLNAVQSEFNLSFALQSAMQRAEGYATSAGDAGGDFTLPGQINALRLSVSDILSGAPAKAMALRPIADGESGGLIGRSTALFRLLQSLREIQRLSDSTSAIQGMVSKMRDPLRDRIRTIMIQSQQMGDQSTGNDLSKLQAEKLRFDAMDSTFKLLSAAYAPLAREDALLQQSLANLNSWRESVHTQYLNVLHGLLWRLGALLSALAILLLVSEIWRRVTLRYVDDARRRRQFLLFRRFAVSTLVAVIVIVAVISDFGSLATFAGFFTAGVAVALQSVLLSVAAYFFLLGRYGVRVGDRITVSGVTGEVIDLGIVRLVLMELVGAGVKLHPTGRVFVLPNSIIFQNTPLYKQMPGTDFGWHEIAMTLKSDEEMPLARDRVLTAVESVFSEYRPLIEKQHLRAERLVGINLEVPQPTIEFRLAEEGLEIVARYPVPIDEAQKVDELVGNAVLAAIGAEPRLANTFSGKPRLGPLQGTP